MNIRFWALIFCYSLAGTAFLVNEIDVGHVYLAAAFVLTGMRALEKKP